MSSLGTDARAGRRLALAALVVAATVGPASTTPARAGRTHRQPASIFSPSADAAPRPRKEDFWTKLGHGIEHDWKATTRWTSKTYHSAYNGVFKHKAHHAPPAPTASHTGNPGAQVLVDAMAPPPAPDPVPGPMPGPPPSPMSVPTPPADAVPRLTLQGAPTFADPATSGLGPIGPVHPAALGAPAPVPEPSTAVIACVLAGAAVAWKRSRAGRAPGPGRSPFSAPAGPS